MFPTMFVSLSTSFVKFYNCSSTGETSVIMMGITEEVADEALFSTCLVLKFEGQQKNNNPCSPLSHGLKQKSHQKVTELFYGGVNVFF